MNTQPNSTAGNGCSSHAFFARATVDADPMAFTVRGSFFRGYYVFSPGNYYMTKDGKWTHGCTAPDDGNWWDTRGDAQRALEKFRPTNNELCQPCPPSTPPRQETAAGQGLASGHCSPVAVLFARADSIYKTMSGVDVWDAERDARNWQGGSGIVAHPPCRAWGRLRHFAKPRPDEKALALWAVDMIRENGGVLEHPASSQLWKEKPLPKAGEKDQWGGWTMPVLQWWWGHKAEKPTLLYIVGCEPKDLPPMPYKMGRSECVIRLDKRRADGTHIRKGDSDYRPALGPKEREATPPAFAEWLVELARKCYRGNA